MKKASYDNLDWARLVREIEQAKAACAPADDVPAEPARNLVQVEQPHMESTIASHELATDLDELLGVDSLTGNDAMPMRGNGIRSHVGWGLGGFLLGAICWHLIGFWDFVGDVVLSGPQNTTIVERSVTHAAKPRVLSYVKKRATSASVETSRNCSAFYRDAETGLARPARCQTVVRALGGESDRR